MSNKSKSTQKWRSDYSLTYPVLKQSTVSDSHAFCSVCNISFTVAHGGITDCKRHIITQKHTKLAELVQKSKSMSSFVGSSSGHSSKTGPIGRIRAEVLFTEFLVEHNIALSVADHASKLFKKMFPDSKISEEYANGRTKTTALVNELACMKKESTLSLMRSGPFSIATDGSNDADMQLYPLIVTYFDPDDERVVNQVLGVPQCDGRCTGENIFKSCIDQELRGEGRNISYLNLLALSVDNANVMTGRKKGVYGFVLKEQPKAYLSGCPCHLIHLAAQKASFALSNKEVDDLLIDLYYYLEKSGNRKDDIKALQEFHGLKQEKVIKHCTTRWLSAGKCISRLLYQWAAIKDFIDAEKSKSKKVKESTKNSANPGPPPQPKSFSDIFGKPVQTQKHDSSQLKRKHEETKSISAESSKKSKSHHESSQKPKSSSSQVTQKKSEHKSNSKSSSSQSQATNEKKSEHKSSSKHSSSTSKSLESEPNKKSKSSKESNQTSCNDDFRQQPERLERMYRLIHSKDFKLNCMFLSFTIPLFDLANQVLQTDAPLIHKTRRILADLLKSLLVRFIKPSAVTGKMLVDVKFQDKINHKCNDDLVIGADAKAYIMEHKDYFKGEILTSFYQRVLKYFITATQYICSKCPINEELLIHAEVVDIANQQQSSFKSVEYFLQRFPVLLPKSEDDSEIENHNTNVLGALQLEFCQYQVEEFHSKIISSERADEQWCEISKIEDLNGNKKYKYLPSVMLGILCIPHSNAGCERTFSFVRKNHTDFRGSLSRTTNESLMILKNNKKPCFERVHSTADLKRLKSAYYQSSIANLGNCDTKK